jgi:hypothetical protein
MPISSQPKHTQFEALPFIQINVDEFQVINWFLVQLYNKSNFCYNYNMNWIMLLTNILVKLDLEVNHTPY